MCSNRHMEGRQFHLRRLGAGRVKGEVGKARLERRKAEVEFAVENSEESTAPGRGGRGGTPVRGGGHAIHRVK